MQMQIHCAPQLQLYPLDLVQVYNNTRQASYSGCKS